MKLTRKALYSAAIMVVLIGLLAFYLPHAAAAPTNSCVTHKHVENWNNASQLDAQGFYPELFQTGTMSNANGILSLDLGASPTNAYAAARITETNNSLPVADRVKCWQPTATQNVVATMTLKLDQPAAFLTENFFFWNAPFGPTGSIPLSAYGVTRSAGSGGQYAAILAQDASLNPDMSINGYLNVVPMPAWLDPTQWHTVRITITATSAQVEVAQGSHDFTTVVNAQLPHAPQPVALEYSVDNELLPGFTIPVYMPDGVDIGPLDIHLR